MKIMIINETDLPISEIGDIIQQIQAYNPEDTNYYGKIEAFRFVGGKFPNRKGYRLQIRYLKKYVEWRFMENESIH